MGLTMKDIGLTTIETLWQRMGVDAEWAVGRPRGFTWWPHGLAQHIWAEECVEDNGVLLSRIHVRTDLVTGYEETSAQLSVLGELLNRPAMFGLTLDPDNPGRIQLAGSVYVHEHVLSWASQLIMTSAVSQACEAHTLAAIESLELAGLRSAKSHHPKSGERKTPDEILQAFVDMARVPPPSPPGSVGLIESTLAWLEENGLPCSGGDNSLVVELPFSEATSLLKIEDGYVHPSFGNGLKISLALPFPTLDWSPDDRVKLAIVLNNGQSSSQSWTHFLGSWSSGPIGPVYLSFVPALLANWPGAGMNLFLAENMRARWVAKYFEQPEDARPPDPMAGIEALLNFDEEQLENALRLLPPEANPDGIRELVRVLREQRTEQPKHREEIEDETPSQESIGPPIEFECPACGLDLSAPPQDAGDTLRCPRCQQLARIPGRPKLDVKLDQG